MANRFALPRATVLDANGAPLSGARLHFYESGTTRPANVYSDSALAVPATNPVVADSAGRFGDIFLQAIDYKVVLADGGGATLWTADPVSGTLDASGDDFAPSQQSPADMTVLVAPGRLFDAVGRTILELAAQTTALIAAPAANPRIDIVHVDRATGAVGVATGAEAAIPSEPAIPAGALPVARVSLAPTTTEITLAEIADVRALGTIGAGSAAARNVGAGVGEVVELVDLGGGTPGLDALDGRRLVTLIPPASKAPSELSNNAASPNTQIDIAAGHFRADDAEARIALSATTIDISTSGDGGRLDSDTLDVNTWYHVLAGRRTSDGAIVAGFKKTIAKPADWDHYRRLGSVLTDGSANIIAFHQDGDEFTWDVQKLDLNTSSPSTAGAFVTLTVPTGLAVKARIIAMMDSSTTGLRHILVTETRQTNSTPSSSLYTAVLRSGTSNTSNGTMLAIATDTSAQIRYRSTASSGINVDIFTIGWGDRRGRDA